MFLILVVLMLVFVFEFGIIAFLNPNFSPSFSLCCKLEIFLTSPPRPTSPRTSVLRSTIWFKSEDVIARQIAKSSAGSFIFRPPTTFKIISWLVKFIFARLISTAVKTCNLFKSKPEVLRWG